MIYEANILSFLGSIAKQEFIYIPIAGAGLLAIFKAIPNDKLYGTIKSFFASAGKGMTLGLSSWKWSKPFWNSVIEPWFIDIIENTVKAAVDGIIEGLRVDNPK